MVENNQFHEVSNPNKASCDICREVSRVCNSHGKEAVYMLPPEIGSGYLKKLALGNATEMNIYDFQFWEEIAMEERCRDESLKISFCLEEAFQWYGGKNSKSFVMGRNESCIFSNGFMHSTGLYEGDTHYCGMGISIHPERYGAVVECCQRAEAVTDLQRCPEIFKTYKITPSVRAVVRQMLQCPYEGALKNMYLEGKVLELIAIYINEVIIQESKGQGAVRLSRQDMESLELAKLLLESNYVEPMTLSELAKAVYINEYKLKTGFKEVYGQSVYSYVIDQRMERAKRLFEERDMKIKEVAGRVGYTNISHFIEAFRKKYGITPGNYLKKTQ